MPEQLKSVTERLEGLKKRGIIIIIIIYSVLNIIIIKKEKNLLKKLKNVF